MKWWDEQAWPWLKKNWWWIPAFPLVGLGMVLARAFSGQKTVLIDPTAKADERAKVEEKVRDTITLEERNRLELELALARKEQDEKRTKFESADANQVEELQADSNKLRDLMIQTGKPQ